MVMIDQYILRIKAILVQLVQIRPSKFAWGLSVLGVLLILMLMHAPARLAGMVNQTENIFVDGFQGSIWNGNASTSALRLQKKWLPLGKANWRLRRAPLLLGAVKLDVQTQHQNIDSKVSVMARGQTLRIHAGHAFVSLKALQPWLPRLFKIQGNLNMQIKDLLYQQGLQNLDLEAFCEDLSIHTLNEEYALGDLVVTVNKTEQAVRLTLIAVENALLDISGTIDYYGDSVNLDVAIKPNEGASELTVKMLRDLGGAPNKEGAYQLKFKHRL